MLGIVTHLLYVNVDKLFGPSRWCKESTQTKETFR